MQAIVTKHAGPGKIAARAQRGRKVYHTPDNLNDREAHQWAARQLCQHFAEQDVKKYGTPSAGNSWARPLVSGGLPNGDYVHIAAPVGYEVPPHPAAVLELRTPSGDGGTLVLDQCGNRIAYFDGVMGRVYAQKAHPETVKMSREPVQCTPAYLKALRNWNA